MPLPSDRLLAPVYDLVHHRKDLVEFGVPEFWNCAVIVKFTETAAERDMLLVRQLLTPEQQNEMFLPCPFDLREGRIIERLGEIDTADLGSEFRPKACEC